MGTLAGFAHWQQRADGFSGTALFGMYFPVPMPCKIGLLLHYSFWSSSA